MLDSLYETLKKNGGKTAFVSGDDILSYDTLAENALYYSRMLRKQGTEPVVIYGHKSADMLTAMLACIMAKRTYVPIDISVPKRRAEKIIGLSGASLVIAAETFDTDFVRVTSLGGLSAFENSEPRFCDSVTAYVIFTSGSTGEPKGIPVLRSNLENFIRWVQTLDFPEDCAVVMNQANFNFDLSVADIFYSLSRGLTLAALTADRQNDPEKIIRFASENGVNIMVATPTFIRLCLLDPDFCGKSLPGLKCVYFCGETLENKVARKLLTAFPGITVINAYGPTEAASAVTAVTVTRDIISEYDPLPVGVGGSYACGVTVENGEIVIKGESVFPGYLGGITGGFYKENGVNCFRTGDLGYEKDGYLFFTGRKDGLIKYKGYRIELSEIEKTISLLPYINGCAVVAKRGPSGEAVMIKAFVTEQESADSEKIKKDLAQYLPAYMIPKVITVMDELPVNDNKKTDRKLLNLL